MNPVPGEATPATDAPAFLQLLQNAGLSLILPVVSAINQPIQPESGEQQPEVETPLAADRIVSQVAMDSIPSGAALLLHGGHVDLARSLAAQGGMAETGQAAPRVATSATLLASGSLNVEAVPVQGRGSDSTVGESRLEGQPHADQKWSLAGPTAKPSHQPADGPAVNPPSQEPPGFTTHALVKTEEAHLRSVETQAATSPAQSAAVGTADHADADHPARMTNIARIETLDTEQVGQLEAARAVPPDEGSAKETAPRSDESGSQSIFALDQVRGRAETATPRVTAAVPVCDVPDDPHQPGQPASLRLEVQQADLGRVRVHVTVSDHAVYANVMTERPDVQELLARQQPRLESGLQGHGLSIGGFHVGLQEHGRGRADLGWTSSGQTDGTRRDAADVAAVPGVGDTEGLALAGDRRLNLFV